LHFFCTFERPTGEEYIERNTQEIAMYEFLEQHSVYVVLVVVLMIWTGLFFYLYRIDKRVKKLEK
jgi:CcmD family protein